MDHFFVARIALSCLCAIQGIATAAIDFNRTHATNPMWTGHARFHVVWQSSTVLFLSALELFLLWGRGPSCRDCFYLAALLAALSPLGFLAALLSRKRFAGTLLDPNGIPALQVKFFGVVRAIDMNLVAVLGALLSLIIIIQFARV